MSNDPAAITQPDALTTLLAPIAAQASAQAAQVATQVATDVANGLHSNTLAITGDLQKAIDAVASDVAANRAAIEDALAKAGSGLATSVATNPKTQQIIIGGFVAAIAIGCIAILIAYLAGNSQAGKIIAGVPTALVGLTLWLSHSGLALPLLNKPAAKA